MQTDNAKYKIGDILKVTQGGEIHYERVIELNPEILTEDLNPTENGDISIQGLSSADNVHYEIVPSWKLARKLENKLTYGIAFSIANMFYGSDYPLSHAQFDNALKEIINS